MAVMEYPADPGGSDSIPERRAVRSDDQRVTSQHDRATSRDEPEPQPESV